MLKNNFFKTLVALIVIFSALKETSSTYCSAYCSYYNLGSSYFPMCQDQTSTKCTKCDENLFNLTSGQCVPHGKFNQTLQRTDLLPLIGVSSDWVSTNNLIQLANVDGLYQVAQFYQDPAIPAGGDDLFYRIYANLPAHFTVKLRFFAIRSASSTMQFSYYLDNKKFDYNYNQYPSNTTLGDIITSDKIFHQNINLTLGFQAKFAAGVTEYIGIKEVLMFISKCSPGCDFCSNYTNCVKCGVTGMGSILYLYQGQCYSECPEKTFDQASTQTCQPCQTQCQNCVGTATNCTQCQFQGRHQTFLLNNSCFYTCPDGYFKDFDTNQCVCPVNGYYINTTTKLCLPCASECNSCYGPLRIQCYNCSLGSFLIYGTQWCSNTCPSGQYGDQLAKKCIPCSSTCSECVNSSTQCTACFFRASTRYLYNSQCISQCPNGYEKNFTLRKCVQCPPFYYSFEGSCLLQCPQDYVSNNETKTCLHITQTNFTLTPYLTGIQVLMKGKTVAFLVTFPKGLSSSSKSWLSSQGYYNANLKIGEQSILTSNIKLQSETVYSFTFALKQSMDESTLMMIDFGTRLKTQQNISFSRTSAEFSISSNPQILGEYYKKSQSNYFNVMFIPALLVMIILIATRTKQSYEMLTQSVRAFQLMALAIFISYPLQSPIFSLLQSLNYFNLEFFPNVYNWLVPTFQNSLQNNSQFAGFRFLYGDMDFIRMIGSILVFIAAWIVFIITMKVFFTKNNLLLGWLLRIGMQIIEIKILHSFWNSLIFTIINSGQNNIYMLWLHLFSYIFIGFTVFRYYKIYQQNQSLNYPFIWRVIATLLLTLAVYQQMVLTIVLSLVSVAFGFIHYRSQKLVLNSVQGFRFAIAFKLRAITLSLLPWLSIFGISLMLFYHQQMSALACLAIMGVLVYLIVIINIIVVVLLRNYFKTRQNKNTNVTTEMDGGISKRITNKQIMQENLNQQMAVKKYQLQTILSKDDNTIISEKDVFIKNQFSADFHIAHKMSVPDMEDSNRQNQTNYERSNFNSSTIHLVESSLKQQLPKHQQKSRVKPLKRNTQHKHIQSWQSNENQDESIFGDDVIEKRFDRGHHTQALYKSKAKLALLQTVDNPNQEEPQFQQIELTKRSNPEDKKPINKMNSTSIQKESVFKRFNTVDVNQQMNKSNSSGVIYYENQQPRKNLEVTQQYRLRSNVFLRDQQQSP